MRDLITRKLSSEVHTLLPTLSASLGVLLFSVLLLINTPLQPLNTQNSLFIFLAAFFIIFGYYTAVLVMRSGEMSFISPFRYTAILFALIIGFIFFDEKPDLIAFVGIIIVMLTGIVLMMRNSSVQKNNGEITEISPFGLLFIQARISNKYEKRGFVPQCNSQF